MLDQKNLKFGPIRSITDNAGGEIKVGSTVMSVHSYPGFRKDNEKYVPGYPSNLNMKVKSIDGLKALCTWKMNSQMLEREFDLSTLTLV